DYGIVNFTINDSQSPGEFDLFNGPDVISTEPISLGTFELPAGISTLHVTIEGKNASAAPGFMFGLDYVFLESNLNREKTDRKRGTEK
ncbi:MAG: hypothetical protein WBD31_27840, partial [Rubripirellula sp.]